MDRKRKTDTDGYEGTYSSDDEESKQDAFSDDSRTTEPSNLKHQKHNHSEIEKRRRDKMNTFIVELSALIPMCNAMNRKLDKLTVLRMAVQHMKFLKGSSKSYSEARPENSILSEAESTNMLLKISDGFLFAVSCDRARILYCSKSVSKILNYSQKELIGQSWFDILHPQDINKIKEQLTTSDLSPRERLIDAKTMMPVKTVFPKSSQQLCSGARRSFFCRMRIGNKSANSSSSISKGKMDSENVSTHKKKKTDRKHFSRIYCSGYVKMWPMSQVNIDEEGEIDQDSLGCLVIIGQNQSNIEIKPPVNTPDVVVRPVEYSSRMTVDGKFQYVDDRATLILGFLPQELIGSSVYEYYHQKDIMYLADIHRKVLQTKMKIKTRPYKFKIGEGNFVTLQSTLFAFNNPFTKEIECIVSNNRLVTESNVSHSGVTDPFESAMKSFPSSSGMAHDKLFRFGAGNSDQNKEMMTISGVSDLNKDVCASDYSRINKAIAEADSSSGEGSTSQVPTADISIPSASQLATNSRNIPPAETQQSSSSSTLDTTLLHDVIQEQVEDMQNPGNNGNDEAALAFLMSLLEADSGLGGPVDFNDIPWPL